MLQMLPLVYLKLTDEASATAQGFAIVLQADKLLKVGLRVGIGATKYRGVREEWCRWVLV